MLWKNKKTLFFLLIILAIAAFFRLWQLNSVPAGLYPDVAMNGNNALETLRNLDFKVFYPDNNGREGMMMWLIALSFSVFGVSIWSIKIVAAVIGILTVLGLYLLTKELFSKWNENTSRSIALLSAFFLAISFWHVNFSRIGFRAILLPFILVFSFYFLFKGLRGNKVLNFILAGVFFGLGFYTYTSFRMAVLILPFIFIPYWFIYPVRNHARACAPEGPVGRAISNGVYKNQNYQKKFILYTLYFLLTVFIVALPIGIYFLQHPQDFISRTASISIFSQKNSLLALGKSLVLHLGMFNFYGDPNWRHNFAGSPELFFPVGILFLIGLAFSIKEIIDFRKHKNLSLVISPLSLVIWFFVMLLPGILTYEGIPHSLRVIGVIPPVFIFSGLGAWKIYEFLEKNAKNKKLFVFACLIFLAALAISEYNKYFVIWAKNENVKDAFSRNYSDIGNFLNSLAPDVKKYVIVNKPGSPLYGISIPAQTPLFIESAKFGKPRTTYLKFEELDQIRINQNKTVVIPIYDGRVFNELSKKFPAGQIKMEKDFKFYDLSY